MEKEKIISRLKSTEVKLYILLFISILIFLLEWVTEGPVQKIVVAPIGEEALKLSSAGLLAYVIYSILKIKRIEEKWSKLAAFLSFVWISAIFSLIMGYTEYVGKGSLLNIYAHFSFTAIGAILVASWILTARGEHKKYGILFAWISILHSISNQYANFKSVTEENEYLVSIAKFLADHTPLTNQGVYIRHLFILAYIMFAAAAVMFPLLLVIINRIKSPKEKE